MRFKLALAILVALLVAVAANAEPPRYILVIASKSGKIPDLVSGLLERKFPTVELHGESHMARYKMTPHYPVPVCANEEYYLLGPANALLGLGCIDAGSVAGAAREIDAKIKNYEKRLTVDAPLR